MKYRMFNPSTASVIKGSPIVFIETKDGVRRFSDDKEGDTEFYDFSKKIYSDPKTDKFLKSLEGLTTGFSYYDSEEGEYSGEAKTKIDGIIKSLGYTVIKL